MRKIIISVCFCFLALISFAQVSSTTGKKYVEITGNKDTINVFMFNGIDSGTLITYNGPGTTMNWYRYTDLVTPLKVGTLDQNVLDPEDATGYVLDVDGKRTYVWVIDYKNYKPDFKSLKAENNPSAQCKELNLILDAKIPELTYKSVARVSYSLPREFKITYLTSKWDATVWKDSTATVLVTLPSNVPITVTAPLRNATSSTTTFTISGDQYAADLDIKIDSLPSTEYTAVAVKSHLTTAVTERSERNEDKKPGKTQPINYSAPIDVQFLSNANEPVAQFYKWEIFKGNALIISRSDKDHRYTFSEAGVYKVKLAVSNATCSFADSITVTVSESAIVAPNVFTPNGDEFNNEFRVGYRSIVKFDCWVYNRWGRLVYHWNDPQKGWDGNINGKKATPGPYFYVIKAFGSDYDPKSEINSVTKRRIGDYLLKGDINLLRDKQ